MAQPDAALTDVWRWSPALLPRARSPFPGLERLRTNHSQAWQDLFVLTMLQGRTRGRYLEVGGHGPEENNNTCLLHRAFGWSGVTLERDTDHLQPWLQRRPDSVLVLADALAIDYEAALRLWFGTDGGRLDYLQLDIDPSINTLQVLERLPLARWRFSVLTFETDAYTGDLRARDRSRSILSDWGYVPVALDVCVLFPPVSAQPVPFEDWWVDPAVVSPQTIQGLSARGSSGLLPQELLFTGAA